MWCVSHVARNCCACVACDESFHLFAQLETRARAEHWKWRENQMKIYWLRALSCKLSDKSNLTFQLQPVQRSDGMSAMQLHILHFSLESQRRFATGNIFEIWDVSEKPITMGFISQSHICPTLDDDCQIEFNLLCRIREDPIKICLHYSHLRSIFQFRNSSRFL